MALLILFIVVRVLAAALATRNAGREVRSYPNFQTYPLREQQRIDYKGNRIKAGVWPLMSNSPVFRHKVASVNCP